METLNYSLKIENPHTGGYPRDFAIAGIVSSGNLEVMLETADLQNKCEVTVNTTADGFGHIWEAVLNDFIKKYVPANVRVSVNDFGASPSVVALRLDCAMEILNSEKDV